MSHKAGVHFVPIALAMGEGEGEMQLIMLQRVDCNGEWSVPTLNAHWAEDLRIIMISMGRVSRMALLQHGA